MKIAKLRHKLEGFRGDHFHLQSSFDNYTNFLLKFKVYQAKSWYLIMQSKEHRLATQQTHWVKITTPEKRVIHSPWHWFQLVAREEKLPYYVIGQIEKQSPNVLKDLIGKVYIIEF